MKPTELNINIIETYFGLLKNLNDDSKLELIAKLTSSLKTTKQTKTDSLKSLYGAFVSNLTADQIIADLKKSRTFKHKRVAF